MSDGGAVPSTILMSARLVPDLLPVSVCVLQIASGVKKKIRSAHLCVRYLNMAITFPFGSRARTVNSLSRC